MKKGDLTLKKINKELLEFEKDFWVVSKDNEGKTRHIALHLGKLIGKIAEVTERREHSLKPDLKVLKSEVIPDLLIYALQLSNLFKVDLQTAFFKRLEHNKRRVRSWKT